MDTKASTPEVSRRPSFGGVSLTSLKRVPTKRSTFRDSTDSPPSVSTSPSVSGDIVPSSSPSLTSSGGITPRKKVERKFSAPNLKLRRSGISEEKTRPYKLQVGEVLAQELTKFLRKTPAWKQLGRQAMLVSGIKEQVDVTLSLLDVNFMEEYEKQDRFMDNTKQILISRVGNLLQQSAEEFWDTLDLEDWIKQSTELCYMALLSLRQRISILPDEKFCIIYLPISNSTVAWVSSERERSLCSYLARPTRRLLKLIASDELYGSNHINHLDAILEAMLKIHNTYFDEAYALKKKFTGYYKTWCDELKSTASRSISEVELESKPKVSFTLACLDQALITKTKKWRRTAIMLLTTLGSMHYAPANAQSHWLMANVCTYQLELISIMKDIRTRPVLLEKLQNFKEEVVTSDVDSPKKDVLEMSEFLIERATSQEATELVGPLMVAFSSMTPSEVWDKLFTHYEQLRATKSADDSSKEFLMSRNRLLNLIIKWIQSEGSKLDIPMFPEKLVERIQNFCDTTLVEDGMQTTAQKIKKLLTPPEKSKLKKKDTKVENIKLFNLTNKHPQTMFLSYTPSNFASQMTLIDHQMFHSIQEWELRKSRWTKENTKIFAQNVIMMIRRIDRISHSIATIILIQENAATRAKIIKFFIGVAEILCNELHNFSSGLAVLNAFSMAAIARLNFESAIGSTTLSKLKALTTLQNPEGKWGAMRAAMAAVPGSKMIPYLGISLGNLMAVEEGNQEQLTIEQNLEKYQLLHSYISEFIRNQNAVRTIEEIEPLYVFCESMPFLEEEFLYELSLWREPKKK